MKTNAMKRALILTLATTLCLACKPDAPVDDAHLTLLESQYQAVSSETVSPGFAPVYFQYADALARNGDGQKAFVICQEYASRYATVTPDRVRQDLEAVAKTLESKGDKATANGLRALVPR